MKARKIGEDRQSRFSRTRLRNEIAHRSAQFRQMTQDLRDPENGNLGIVRDDIHASRAHLRSAHSENFHVRVFLQFLCETRGVHIPARFARGKKNLCWRHREEKISNRWPAEEKAKRRGKPSPAMHWGRAVPALCT